MDSSPAKLSLAKESPPVAIRRLKYEMCKNWREKGACKYGDRCLFAHGDNELTKTSNQAFSDSAKSEISSPPVEEREESKFKTPEKTQVGPSIFFTGESDSTQNTSAFKS